MITTTITNKTIDTSNFKNISMSVEHRCIHPVISCGAQGNVQGGYNKVWIEITSKGK